VLSAIAAALAFALLPEAREGAVGGEPTSADAAGVTLRETLQRPGLPLFICQFCFHTCAVSASVYLFPLWVADGLAWQAREVGLFFGLIGIVMVLTQGNILGLMTDRFGNLWVLRGAAICFSGSLALSAIADGAWFMGLLGLTVFSAATLCLPVLNTIASHLVTAASRGQFFGITASAAACGRILGPLVASALLAKGGFDLAWLGTSAVVMFVVTWSLTFGARLVSQHTPVRGSGGSAVKPKCVITLDLPEDIVAPLQSHYEVMAWAAADAMPEDYLQEWLGDARGLLCALSTPITASVVASAEQLKVISTISVGVDHIDLAAATAAGIPVGHTPGVLVDSTADLAVGLMIAATRRIAEADRWIRTGQWSQGWQSDLLLGTDLSQATVGIVGLGPIGEATVKRLSGFGATILGWNRTPKTLEGVEMVDLEDLFRRCDIVSLHTALTPDTLQIASRKRLASMRSGATLINTGRGALVDEEALIEALSSGRLRAGLDVFESEPLPTDHPLFSLDNAVLLPHVGSATVSTRMAMVTRALENLRAGMSGQPLPFCANPEVCGFSG
jgi:glyoxylate reductase